MSARWRDVRADVRASARAIARANSEGKEIPNAVYAKMHERFSEEEIGFIESYVFLAFFHGGIAEGADYMTQAEMERKIDELQKGKEG